MCVAGAVSYTHLDVYKRQILPRIIVGIVAALVFIGIMKLSKGKTAVSAGIAAAVGALTNTVLVLTMMNLLYAEELTSTFGKTIQTIFNSIFSINGLFEIVGAAVISIPCLLYTSRCV